MDDDNLIITVTRGTTPVLVTGDRLVVGAVVDALVRALRGPEQRRVVRLVERAGAADGAPEPSDRA